MANTDNFIKTYHGHGIEDAGCYNSEEMKSFARKFRNYLKRCLSGWNIVKYSCRHYFVSTFLEKDGRYVYLSYNVPRGGLAMNLYSGSWDDGVLIRLALNDSDYSGKGGWNHYTSVACIGQDVERLVRDIPVKREKVFY